MVKVKFDYMAETPHLSLMDSEDTSEREKELFKTVVIPGLQKDVDIAFMEYKRNSPELGSALTQIMNHGASLEKSHYIFGYYENIDHVGYYTYIKPDNRFD